MALLPRVRSIALPAVLMAAAGCMLLSLLFASSKTASSLGLHLRHSEGDDDELRNQRQLAAKLMDSKELIRYDDPKTIGMRITHNLVGGNDQQPIASSFWWDDIYYEQNPLCGQVKCFFLSVSDPSRGYLIWDAGYTKWDGLAMATDAYNYAAKVESEDNIRQFFTSPPFQMGTPQAFKEQLTEQYKVMFPEAKSLIIQPSLTAPEGSIIIRCYNDRVLFNRLDHILENGAPGSKERLVEELERNIPFMASHQELGRDFQLMIDLEGRTYHLDFDRVSMGFETIRPKRAEKDKKCLEDAADYVRKSMNTA